ncbi:MAG TPA: hypothetical protein VF384_17425 [Planctomycetota bacterium]
MSPLRTLLVALLPLTLVDIALAQEKKPGAPAPAPDNPRYAEALARYKDCITRIPFRYHTDGRERLAETREMEAFRILSQDYVKSDDYPEYTRYTLGSLFGRHFTKSEFVDGLDALRKANDKPVDTWMWVKALKCKIDAVGDAEAIEIAQTDKNVLHRAAAIAAIGESRNGNLKAVILPICADFPKKEYERYMLLGAMSGALIENKRRVNDEEYREALTAYIGLLGEEVDLPHTAKVQMARHLHLIVGGPALFINQQPWLDLLKGGDVKAPQKGHTVVAPRFFGVETEGERFCYVIDMSDSMLMPISPGARPPEPSGPVTGPRQPPKKKKRELLDEEDLPWDKIKNRWDLAREHLKISLWRLTPDKHFAVVWFGDESGTLDSCKGMIKATKGNVDRVVAELDSIKPIKPEEAPAREGHTKRKGVGPEGKVLRGNTNMHSGVKRAFGLAGKGFVEEFAYVDPEALTEGCDTIFLLSDGAPTMDDFYVSDKDYGEGNVVEDQETATPAQRTPRLWYPGPYAQDDWLVEDVRRMNAFRRIRLHTIGLGEANDALMSRLAEIGRGEYCPVGKKKAEAADGGSKK